MKSSTADWTAYDGTRLFTRRWEPDGDVKAVVLLVHGLGEHSGRYEDLVSYLCKAGYLVRAFDLRGHGRSDGRRGDTRFAPTFRDIDRLLDEERTRNLPVFLYGHSLGGLIVLAYALERRRDIDGVIASAPALHSAIREQRIKVALTHLLGKLIPHVSVPSGLEPAKLSRIPEVVEDYERDPLVHRRMTFGFGEDGMTAIDRVVAHPGPFPAPLLLLHGEDDEINYVSGSRAIAARFGEACTLHVYPGILHQPHTDPDSPRVFADLVAWLDAQRSRAERSDHAGAREARPHDRA